MSTIPENPIEKTIGMPGSQYIWRRYLDPIIDQLMTGERTDDMPTNDELKAAARAYANAIAAIPGCENTGDQVAKRAVTRWKIRQGLIPWEMTPGYGYADDKNDDPTEQGRRGMWPPGYVPSQPESPAPIRASKRAVTKTVQLPTPIDPELKSKIGSMLDMGMPASAIATRFKLTTAQVESCKHP